MSKFKVISYNIWFSDNQSLERTLSLINCINSLNPDVICLQEVRSDIHEILTMLLNNYKYCFPKKITKGYDCVTFSKHPIHKCLNFPYKNSNMGRGLYVVQIRYNNIDMIIANSHFESLFKKNVENETKMQQYQTARSLLDSLHQTYKNVILCSDTNVMSHEEETFDKEFKDNGWIDAWAEKGNDTNKYTYDSENNAYLKIKLQQVKYKSRIDRIFSKSVNCQLAEFDMIGGYDIEPSDHFGIVTSYMIR
jgi:exonuclease III